MDKMNVLVASFVAIMSSCALENIVATKGLSYVNEGQSYRIEALYTEDQAAAERLRAKGMEYGSRGEAMMDFAERYGVARNLKWFIED